MAALEMFQAAFAIALGAVLGLLCGGGVGVVVLATVQLVGGGGSNAE